ncbi:MAG: Fic family protein [Clostridia bacterium]
MKQSLLNILNEQKEIKLKGNLYHHTQIAFCYNTNHIEGSTLTEEQTRHIFETNSFIQEEISSTNIDDLIEAVNHFKLFDYMLDTADDILTEDLIKEYHKILKSSTSDSRKDWFNVGDYKKLANQVGNTKTTTPANVSKEMRKTLDEYNSLTNITINNIINFHSNFEKIHPFQDGNGRVGRIIAFKECLKNNIIPFIIFEKDKLFYYRGLSEYQNNKEQGYLIDTCLNGQDRYKIMIDEFLN